MAFDPSVIGDIGASGPDVVGSIQKGFQLKDMVDTNQLNQLKLNSAKTDASDQAKAKSILSSSNLSTEKGLAEASEKLTRAGLPERAMELSKYGQSVASGQLDQQVKQLQIYEQSQGAVVGVIDPIVRQADSMRQSGKADAMIQAYIQAQTPLALQQLQEAGLPPQSLQGIMKQLQGGPISYDKLKSFEASSKQGQDQIKTRLAELQANTAEKKESETERHNKRMEEEGQDRIDKPAAGAPSSTDMGQKTTSLLASLTSIGASLPQGMRSRAVLQQTLEGLITKYPDLSPDEIAQKIKTGQIDMGVSKTEGSVLGRREAAILPVEKSITKPGGFLDQAESAVKAVDLPKLKAAGRFETWTKDQNSDPDLTRYKAAVAELRAEYSIVLSKGGQVTDAARHEAEKVIPDLITPEQFKSIRKTVQQGIESSKSGVEESIKGVAGGEDSDIRSQADRIISGG